MEIYMWYTILSTKEVARNRPCDCFEEAECLKTEQVPYTYLIVVYLRLVKSLHSFS